MDLKRARLEKDVLEGMLFRLFERQSTWNFGQLQRETDQPAMWLKARLSCPRPQRETGLAPLFGP